MSLIAPFICSGVFTAIPPNIVFKYVKKDYYDIGKINITGPFGREISVYDKERTILDIIKDKKGIDDKVFSEVIKSHLQQFGNRKVA